MFIKRIKYLEQIEKYYESNLIKVLTGIRRSGKSVILKQIQEDLMINYNIKADHIVSINLEDISYAKINSYVKLNSFILSRIIDNEKHYIFIDEIQHIKQFEKVLASLKATSNVSIFVTGSNSKLLSGKLATLLVGRCKEFKIMPFTYLEFIEFYKQNNIKIEDDSLNNYIRYGGMPQRLDYTSEEDIKSYLKDVYYGIIEKDICNKNFKANKEVFNTISKYIICNSTKEFSISNIATYFNKNNDDKIFREEIYRYLEKLEQACLINRVARYDIATKRNLKKIEKQFVVDNGFILACSDSNQISLSHGLENVIYNELIYRGYDVRIGKTYKGEIDFVAMKDGKKCFIQVAYLLASEEIIDREFNAFKSIKDNSPKYVLSLDKFDMSRDGIVHISIEDFLLNKKNLIIF